MMEKIKATCKPAVSIGGRRFGSSRRERREKTMRIQPHLGSEERSQKSGTPEGWKRPGVMKVLLMILMFMTAHVAEKGRQIRPRPIQNDVKHFEYRSIENHAQNNTHYWKNFFDNKAVEKTRRV